MWYGSRAIDEYSGTSDEHRWAWVEDKVLCLSSVFAIGICAYAVMSNHVHLALCVVNCCVWIKKKSRARCAPSSVMVFVSNPFEPATFFQQQKRVARKCRSLPKFLTAQKDLVYGRQSRCRSKSVPPTSTQMSSPHGVRCHFPLKQAFFCWNFKCGKSSGGATKAVVGEADACDFSSPPEVEN